MINSVTMKGKWIIIPFSLQGQILDKLHSNQMEIEKMWLLTRESVNWINIKANIDYVVKQCSMCFEYQWTQPHGKALLYEIPGRLWEVVGTDVLMINSKTLLCTVDYHSKFPTVKKVNNLSAGNLVQMIKLIFAEYRLLKETVSDVNTNFTAETFKDFCRKMNIQQTITSSYHHHSNGQVDACIKFVKCTITKCLDTNRNIIYLHCRYTQHHMEQASWAL